MKGDKTMKINVKGLDRFTGKRFDYVKESVAQVTYLNSKLVLIYKDGTTGIYDSTCTDDLMVTVLESE